MIVLVTGATSGFGYAIAKQYGQLGATVIACARRFDRLSQLKREIGDHCHIYELNVRDRNAVEHFFKTLPNDLQDIDIVVNNAGLALGLEKAHEANLDDWEQMVDTNIKGLMYVTRFALPRMVARNTGHIVNIGSIAGAYPYPGGNTYGGTKAFVRQFSLNLRADLLGTKIRVTDIAPGLANTEFSLVRFKHNQAQADSVYDKVMPLLAEDVANCVTWVTSLPPHMNINFMEVMPTCQAFAPFAIHRE